MAVDILLITCKKSSDHSHRGSSENKHRLVCRQSRADNREQACQKDRSSGLQKRPNMDPSDTEINFMTISYKWQPKDWSSLCVTVYESGDYSRSFRSLRWSLQRCFSNCYPQICSNTLTPMWVTLERVSRQLTSRRVLEFKETTNTTTNTSDYAGLNKISNWFSITLSSHFGADRKRLVQQKITADCLGSRVLILPVIQTVVKEAEENLILRLLTYLSLNISHEGQLIPYIFLVRGPHFMLENSCELESSILHSDFKLTPALLDGPLLNAGGTCKVTNC